MSRNHLLAGCLIVGVLVGLASPQVFAADAPTTAPPLICTGLVPDDAFAALVLYPQRVLANEALAKFDVKGMADDLAKQTGISPMEVDQFVVLVGPPVAGKPAGKVELRGAVIGRLSKSHDGTELATRWIGPSKPEAVELLGHTYFRHATAPGAGTSTIPCVCMLDARTFVVCNEAWIADVLGAKGAKSILISALAANDPAADATIIFTNTDAAKAMIAGAVPAKSLAGPLKPVGDLPDLLQAVKLSIHTNPEISLKLTLVGNDDASADKMAQMIKSLQELGQQFLPALQPQPGENIPAEQRESRELMASMATKLVNGLVPHQAGKQVTVEIDKLGTLDTVVGKLVMPAIMAARGAARRIQSINNLKQLALAMFQCESVDGHFPAHAIVSKEGKPLLSWRVYVLPYLEQDALFKQFHLDEPWDSANNKPLIAKMPAIFKSTAGTPLAEGQTRYVVPTGKDTIFDGEKGLRIADITDGTSNTLLIVEAGDDKAVTWTKPDDMPFDPQKPLAGLGTIGDEGISVAFADGSVRMIRKSIDAETFRRLILRNDGQVVDTNKF